MLKSREGSQNGLKPGIPIQRSQNFNIVFCIAKPFDRYSNCKKILSRIHL